MKRLSLVITLTATLLGGCAAMGYGGSLARTSQGMLVGANNMTLYTFDRDVGGSGKSVCNGPCATNWPPLMAADGSQARGDYSVITRDDGKKQWAFRGKPLYYWIKDSKPGDSTGDGVNGVWRIARP